MLFRSIFKKRTGGIVIRTTFREIAEEFDSANDVVNALKKRGLKIKYFLPTNRGGEISRSEFAGDSKTFWKKISPQAGHISFQKGKKLFENLKILLKQVMRNNRSSFNFIY